MFTFDDLIRIDDKGIQEVMRVIDKSKLALALKGAAPALRNLIFNNMSERSGNMLKEDIESLGKVRLKDVDTAQGEILMQVKDLIEREVIVLRSTEEAEEEKYVE